MQVWINVANTATHGKNNDRRVVARTIARLSLSLSRLPRLTHTHGFMELNNVTRLRRT